MPLSTLSSSPSPPAWSWSGSLLFSSSTSSSSSFPWHLYSLSLLTSCIVMSCRIDFAVSLLLESNTRLFTPLLSSSLSSCNASSSSSLSSSSSSLSSSSTALVKGGPRSRPCRPRLPFFSLFAFFAIDLTRRHAAFHSPFEFYRSDKRAMDEK